MPRFTFSAPTGSPVSTQRIQRVPNPLPALLLLALLLLSTSSPSQTTHFLRLALPPASVRPVLLTMEQTVTQHFPQNTQTVRQRTVLGQTFKVEEVDSEGTMKISIRYDSVYHQLIQENPTSTLTMEFDSNNPPDALPPMAVGYAALVGKTFQAQLSCKGTILEVEGVQEMLSSILDQLKVTDPTARQKALTQLRSRFGAKAIKETMQSLFAIYPEEPISPGASWSKTVTLSQDIPIQVATTWTLKQVKESVAVIDLTSQISEYDGEPGGEGEEQGLEYHLSGQQSGILRIDLGTGWLLSTEVKQCFHGSVVLKTESPEQLEIPLTLEGKVTLQPR